MFGVLYLRNVLKFIIHGFYNSSFLSKSLSETLIKAPFMLLFNLVISCIPSTKCLWKRFFSM